MMKTRCGHYFLLCCVLACLYGCTDAKLSVTENAGNALCIQNEHKVYMINEYNLKTRYCDECIDGYCKQCKDNRCENDSENIGNVYQCTKGRWKLDGEDNRIATKCSASCNKDKNECGNCKNGSIICYGDSDYFVCVDGEYSDVKKTCMTGKCAQDQCAECKSNICLGKKKVKVCLTSSWQGDYDCEDDEICVAGECVNKCTPKAIQCSESDEDGIKQGIIYTCNENGGWNEGEPCGKGILCNIDQTGCAACANGETNEEGQTCVEGEWVVTETTCHEGEKKCEFSIEYQCIGRNWEIVTECANGCDPTNDSCLQINSVDQSCETGQQVCHCDTSGCAIYECQNNHLEQTDPCPYGCDKDGRNCREIISEEKCQKGQTKCDNNKEFTCEEDGEWSEGNDCGDVGCEGDKCKQEETSTKCDTQKYPRCDGTHLIKCEGDIETSETCKLGCDIENKKCKESSEAGCTNNEMRCISTSKTPQICKDGQWVDTVQGGCKDSCAVNINNEAYCTFSNCEYALVCRDDDVKICNNDYTDCTEIDDDISCNDLTKENLSQMYINSKHFSNGSELWEMNGFSGLYQDETLLNGNYACLKKIDEYLNSCNYIIKKDNGLKICKADECLNYQHSAAHQDSNLCPNNEKCINYNNTGIEVSSCHLIDGIACIFATECKSGYSCNSSKKCGNCKNGTMQCSGNTPQTCSDGVWENQTPCSNGAECVENKEDNSASCNDNNCDSVLKVYNRTIYLCEGDNCIDLKSNTNNASIDDIQQLCININNSHDHGCSIFNHLFKCDYKNDYGCLKKHDYHCKDNILTRCINNNFETISCTDSCIQSNISNHVGYCSFASNCEQILLCRSGDQNVQLCDPELKSCHDAKYNISGTDIPASIPCNNMEWKSKLLDIITNTNGCFYINNKIIRIDTNDILSNGEYSYFCLLYNEEYCLSIEKRI